MKIWLRSAALTLVLVCTVRASGSPSSVPSQADCVFTHPDLPGFCSVTVPVPRHSSIQQTCESVLRCINGSACADAQKYCPNPGVSKIWKLDAARPGVVITASTPRVDCGYSNPGYSGWCRLTVPVPDGTTPKQACEMVVPCLNGTPCPGYVNFCGPDLHSGWQLAQVGQPVRPATAPKR
jgi:hypothetical protein